jgi:hypothetical protein
MKWILLLLITLLFSYGMFSSKWILNEFEIKLVQTLQDHPNSILLMDVNELTDFQWDLLYTIHPYSNKETIKYYTNLPDVEKIETSIEHSDGISLLIFVKENQIARYFEVKRSIIDFSEFNVIESHAAKFKINSLNEWKIPEWIK